MLSNDSKQDVRSKSKDFTKDITESSKMPYNNILRSLTTSKKKGRNLKSYVLYAVRMRLTPSTQTCENDFLCPSHPRNAFTEDFNGELPTGFFETPYKSLHPQMITKAGNIGKSDPVTELIHKTNEWVKRWSCFKGSCGRQKKKSRAYKWLAHDVLYCPKYFVEMAEHIEKKPDRFFHEGYNWYYGGKGNFAIVTIAGVDYIICSEFHCLKVSPFIKDTLTIDDEHTATYTCSEDTNIFETVFSQNIIALRTKCKIIILKMTIHTEIQLEKVSEITSELPYTSLSFDEFHKNILYVTALDYQLTIINIDRMTSRGVKLRGKITTLEDNWSSVIGAERGCYLHITKKALTLYDKRTNEPYQRYKSLGWLSDILTCMQMTTAKYCPRKPLMYVGTTHELFLIDMRCTRNKDDNMTPVQRWTHGMMSPPVYLNICNYSPTENKEAICLASQWFEDMCVVTNYSDRLTRVGEIPGLSMPYRPPSVLNTYHEAQRRRLCCSVDGRRRHRLCTSITGAAMINHEDSYSVLLQNSLGDISCHSFHPQERLAFYEDEGMQKLHEWLQQFDEGLQDPLNVNKVVDLCHFLKRLRQVPDDYILGRNPVIKQRWHFNEEEIYDTYLQERLDPAFLEVWKDQLEPDTPNDTNGMFFADS